MTNKTRTAAAIAGAVGSAAIAAALLYAGKRRDRAARGTDQPPHGSTPPHLGTGAKPETD